jgi:hypothetical protein
VICSRIVVAVWDLRAEVGELDPTAHRECIQGKSDDNSVKNS